MTATLPSFAPSNQFPESPSATSEFETGRASTTPAGGAETVPPATSPTRIDLLYLSEPDMVEAGVKDMPACVATMESMFASLAVEDYRMGGVNNNSHGTMVDFPEQSPHDTMPLNSDDRRFMAMPAYLGGDVQKAGVKWYGSNCDNRNLGLPRSIHMFVLNDKNTGAPLAIMSANLLSAYRTGAVPGVGAKYLARPDSEVLGVVGPGVMSRTSVEALAATCPNLTTIKIKGRSQRGIDEFADFVRSRFPQFTTIEVVDSIEEACRDSDIISIAATGGDGSHTYPKVEKEWLKPGAFLSLPANAMMDPEFLTSEGVRTVVDNYGLYEAWADENPFPTHEKVGIIGNLFLDMEKRGQLHRDRIEDLSHIVAGMRPGRTNDSEIIVFSVGGMPVEDVAWANHVYHNALRRGIGTSLNLWESPELA